MVIKSFRSIIAHWYVSEYNYTVNSPNNGHFGARPGYCPLFGVRPLLGNYCCMEPDMEWKFLANIDYMDRVNISQGYESTSNL